MPSNAVKISGDGKVRCRMINDEIPVHICESEQGAKACKGCSASTRRCTKCGKTRGITNPEFGLCKTCEQKADIEPRSEGFQGTPDKALMSALDRVRSVGLGLRRDEIEQNHVAHDSDLLNEENTELIERVENLLFVICEHFNLSISDILRSDKHTQPAFARHVAMFLCRTRLGCSFSLIGRLMGGRDHTTAMHGVRKIEAGRKVDAGIRGHLETIESELATATDRVDLHAALEDINRTIVSNNSVMNGPAMEEFIAMVNKLPANGAEVIRLRYGIGQTAPLTLEETGNLCKLSRQRVKQIEDDSFKTLESLGVLSAVIKEIKSVANLIRTKDVRNTRTSSTELKAPRLVKDLAVIYPTLMEHGVESDGIWKVSSPIAILMRRLHLLRPEAVDVLVTLAKKRYLSGESPWDEIVLIKTEGIEEIKHKLESPRAQYNAATPKRSRRDATRVKKVAPSKPAKQTRPIVKQRTPRVKMHSIIQARLPSLQPIATYGEIYAHLVSRSNEVRGEQLVGGAVPMLQIRFKLSAVQSTEALEWLVSNNHLTQKDDWRTIALDSKEVVSDEGPVKQQSPSRKTSRRGVRKPAIASSTTDHKAGRAEKVKPVSKVSSPPITRATPSTAGTESIDGALAELEQTLPILRKQRDDLAVHVAQLEVAYQTLKALQSQMAEAQQLADSSLSEAVRAAQGLLSFLRK